jgi:hypothetical protein
MNEKTHLRIMRDKEFLDLYHETLNLMLANGVKDARRAAINFALYNGHPHYYVSFDRAYIVVCSILRHDKSPINNNHLDMMWHEIASRVEALTAAGNVSIATAIKFVLDNCRASRFFLSEKYAYHNTYRASHERREMLNRRYAA